MIKYISIFRLVLIRCLLVARKENLTGFSTGLTNRSKNLDRTGNLTGRSTRPVSISGLHGTLLMVSTMRIRGGVLEDVLGLEDVLEDTF